MLATSLEALRLSEGQENLRKLQTSSVLIEGASSVRCADTSEQWPAQDCFKLFQPGKQPVAREFQMLSRFGS